MSHLLSKRSWSSFGASFAVLLGLWLTPGQAKANLIADLGLQLETIFRSFTFQGNGTSEIGLGPSATQLTVDIYNRHTGKHEASFPGSFYIGPGLSLVGEWEYFGNSRIGWLFESSFGSINNKKQRREVLIESVDTELEGSFIHMNPVLFYRFGDKFHKGVRHWSCSVGIGPGITFLNLQGKAVSNLTNNPEPIQVSIRDQFFLQPGMHMRLKFRHWFFSAFNFFGGRGAENGDQLYVVQFTNFTIGRYFLF